MDSRWGGGDTGYYVDSRWEGETGYYVDSRWDGPVTHLTLDFLSKYSLIDGWVG